MGEEVGAFVRLNEGVSVLTQKDVRKFCEGRLSHFKIPRFVVVVDEFPRTLSGKIQKFKFVEAFEDKLKEAMKTQ